MTERRVDDKLAGQHPASGFRSQNSGAGSGAQGKRSGDGCSCLFPWREFQEAIVKITVFTLPPELEDLNTGNVSTGTGVRTPAAAAVGVIWPSVCGRNKASHRL